MGSKSAFVVQKKLMPFKKPRKRGGSPSGVREPPILATRKIKKMIICTLCFLDLFAFNSGRIKRIAEPVVPIHDDKIVPIDIMAVLINGVPARYPFNLIPPEIVKRDRRRMINGKYSSRSTCNSWNMVSLIP